MNQSKIISFFALLSAKERRRFKELVDSPLFNKHKKLRALTDLILSYSPNFTHKNLDRKLVFAKLFPKAKYNEAAFKNLVSDLMKLMEKYLALENFQDSFFEKYALLKAIADRNMENHFQGIFKKSIENSSIKNFLDLDYLDQYILHSLSDQYQSQDRKTNSQLLQKKSDYLDLFYILQRLRVYCDMFNRQNIISDQYTFHSLQSFLKILHENSDLIKNDHTVHLYHLLLILLMDVENENKYKTYLQGLEKSEGQVSTDDLKALYSYAQNYCIRKINTGQTQYLEELFNIYKILIYNKLIYQDGLLAPSTFKNIVTLSVRLKEYDWTKNFINQSEGNITEEYRVACINYNLAYYHTAVEQYDIALKLLIDVEFPDVYYQLGAKMIQIKCFYKKRDFETLYSFIDSAGMFLSRNKKLSQYQKEIHRNHINILKKIGRISELYKPKDIPNNKIKELDKILETKKKVANIGWIKEEWNKIKHPQQ